MYRNRKAQWMAAAVVAVAMVAGPAMVAHAGGIGIPLPEGPAYGDRTVGFGHNTHTTLDLGDVRRWLPMPLAVRLPLLRLPILGYEEYGMPVEHNVLVD